MTINNQIKQLVRKRANYLCEYVILQSVFPLIDSL